MSAPAWTSRSTTSVWPSWLAAYTGLIPSCMEVKNDTGKRHLCCTNAPSNHTNFIWVILPTTCCHVRFVYAIDYQEVINEKSSLARQPYFSYVHACAYDKWAGGILTRKIRPGTLDRFSCHGNMRGIFLREINASVGICSSRQFPPFPKIDTPTRAHLVLHWRTNHHDDIFARACVQLIEEKRKEAITKRPVGRLTNTSVPAQML